MDDIDKTKAELIAELKRLRRRLSGLTHTRTTIERLKDELQDSEGRFRSLLEHSAEGIACFEHDPGIPVDLPAAEQVDRICRTARVADCNDAFARGVRTEKADEIIGKLYVPDIMPLGPEILAIVEKFVSGGHRLVGHETTFQLPGGSKVHFLNDTYGIIQDGRLVRSWAVNRDITRQKEAEEALRQSELKFRTFFNSSGEGILVHSMTPTGPDRIVEVNDTLLGMLGYSREEFLGLPLVAHMEEEEIERAPKRFLAMLDQGSVAFEMNLITRKGDRIPVICQLSFVDLGERNLAIASMTDITERKRGEARQQELLERLQRAQRLETVGRLAGGIAHDFNNILTPIICNAERALEGLSAADPLHEDFQDILSGANRARELVKQILTFSRQLEPELQNVDMPAIIDEALQLLRPVFPPSVKVEQRIDRSCRPLWADPSQIHQIVFNLCNNAYQALPGAKGTITIELKQDRINAETAGLHPNFRVGEYIRLSVSDTGVGMNKAVRTRIFEPYFTTKGIDKGSGLGLSVVYGIVRQNNGEIVVLSEPDRGSTFHVYLPFAAGSPGPVPRETGPVQGGRESILVVDDERSIVRAVGKMLDRLGYQVEGRSRCAEALEAVRANSERYDLVITDLTMPDMSGLELAGKLQEIRPGLPVILTSGFQEAISESVREECGIREIVVKPLSRRKIAEAIRRALDG